MVHSLSQITGWKILKKVPAEMLGKDKFRTYVEKRMKETSSAGERRAEELTLKMFGFDPFTGKPLDEEIDPKQKGPNQPSAEQPLSPSAERRRRATGADKLLTFFTGDRRGQNAYVNRGPVWSARALEKINERRRSSAGLGNTRKGPFKAVRSRTGAVGGGRGGAGARTMKARVTYGSA